VHQGNSEGPKVTQWFAGIRNYLDEVRREMKDVSWPAWIETRSTTMTVVVFVLALAAYVYVVDQICLRLIDRFVLHQP
jgi:preprotein translocase subunit SecE